MQKIINMCSIEHTRTNPMIGILYTMFRFVNVHHILKHVASFLEYMRIIVVDKDDLKYNEDKVTDKP